MRHFLLLLAVGLLPHFVFGQSKLDSLIDVGNELYESGEKKKALKIWENILTSCSDSSSTFGTTLRNIQFYYIEENNERKLLKCYNKLMSSKLNDRDENYELGEPFKNYRYHSTMNIASYYAKKKEFIKALAFVNKADNEIIYETTSLTAFIYQKVDLAFWKARLFTDLQQNDSCFYVLTKRALEYDYKNIYSNWVTVSPSNDEKELADKILKKYATKDSLKILLNDLTLAFSNLEFEKGKQTIIKITIQKIKFDIVVHSNLNSKEECKKFLENSFFYKYLLEKDRQNSH